MKILLLLLLSIKYIESSPRMDPLVNTPRGLVRGLQASDGDYDMFFAVPYGEVDDNNPFGDALPHPGFNGTFDATKESDPCVQASSGEAIGVLNCLTMNIYVPHTATSSNKLPVMFYVPGGYFVVNNASIHNLGPKYLVRHDVIVVTIQFRVGPYGFLCIDTPGYNNQGIKDQVIALKWIRDNIGSFGGDATKVTAFGNSAGATTLDMLLFAYEGLFQRVILQSGNAMSPWGRTTINNSIPIDIANELGFETNDLKQALNYLKTAEVPDVVRVANYLKITDHSGHPLTKPCIGQASEVAIMPEFPIKLKPKVKDLDIMIGNMEREVAFKYPELDELFYNNYQFSEELDRDFNEIMDEEVIKHFYIGDEEPAFDIKNDILDFASDVMLVHPVERSIKRFINEKAKSVYWYLFAYDGGRNKGKAKNNLTSKGTVHGDDTAYLWATDLFPEEPTEEDQKVIDVMTKLWTDFAKFGNPTPSGPSDLIPVTWQKIEGDKRPYLLINNTVSLENRPFAKRMAFWDVYYKLHSDYVKGNK